MNKKALVFAVMAVCLSSATSAFAQDRNYNNDRHERSDRYERNVQRQHFERSDRYERNVQQQRGERFDRNGDGRDDRYQGSRRVNDHDRDRDRGYAYRGHERRYATGYGFRDGYRGHHVYRGAGPRHDLHRGARLSHQYRGHRYVVNDWRSRRLSAPPYGTQWVQTGNDYVLVAIATGIIAQVLLGN